MEDIMEQKLEILDKINEVFEAFVSSEYRMACDKGCAVCCTHDLTATTLEAYRFLKNMPADQKADFMARLAETAAGNLFRPKVTTNVLAMACLTRQEPPAEEPGPNPGPCPFLDDNLCQMYESRPFSCRGMFALTRCQPGAEADLPPELVTIVTIIWQIIEHLDAGGVCGNLIDLLLALDDEKNLSDYTSGEPLQIRGLPPTRPVPGFLVPPEQQEVVGRFLQKLLSTDCNGRPLRERIAAMRDAPF